MKKFVRYFVKNFKCSKIMCSTFQILLLLTCFVALSTQKENDVRAKNVIMSVNKAKREAALADGSEFFGLADALKPKVHNRYSALASRLQSDNNFRVFDSLEGFRAGLNDLGHDKVETYIIKTEEDGDGRPSAVYKVFASDPNLVAQTFGNNFQREIKSHKSHHKAKFIPSVPKSEHNRGFPSFDVNQVKTRNFPLKNQHNKHSMPANINPYQNSLKGNAILYRQGNPPHNLPVEMQHVKQNQVQSFNAQTQATPVHNCNHKQEQGYTYAQPQTANGQAHPVIAVSNQAIQEPRFNGHSSNNNNLQQQQQSNNVPTNNGLSHNYQNAQTQHQNVNQNNQVPVNHQPNHAGTFNNPANNVVQKQGNQADKGPFNNAYNQLHYNNNNNFATVVPPQALTHVIQGPVHNTPQGTVKYFNVAVTSNDHIPHTQTAHPNYANAANNQEENGKFLQGQAAFNAPQPHTTQSADDSLTMMKETGPSYGYGGAHGDLSASLDAVASFGQMPTESYAEQQQNYDYPTATITHLGAADAHDQAPAYAQGHKGLSHFSTTKTQHLNTDTIDSSKYNSEEHFKPSHFLGAINNAGPPTSGNYEYPDPSGEYAAPVFETESLYSNHRYQ